MRSPIILYGVFALIGAIALLSAIYSIYESSVKLSSWEITQGTIVDLGEDNSDPTAGFTYNGQKMTASTNFSGIDYRIGDPAVIHFPPGKPEEAELKDGLTLWGLPAFLGIFCLFFGGVGFYGLSKQLKKMGAKRDLFDNQQGKKLSLQISSISLDKSFKVNGRSPYVISCQWLNPLTNLMHEFKSDYVWYHPGVLLGERKQLDVYIDENDLSRYYLDISFLPEKA